MEFKKTVLFLRIHFRLDFLCLISLVSSFAKEETRETRRKEKKEERLPRSRLPFDKIPLRRRGEFYLLSCVTCGHSTSANSAGPNHSLRIRWSVEMVGGNRLSTSYPVGVGASTIRFCFIGWF